MPAPDVGQTAQPARGSTARACAPGARQGPHAPGSGGDSVSLRWRLPVDGSRPESAPRRHPAVGTASAACAPAPLSLNTLPVGDKQSVPCGRAITLDRFVPDATRTPAKLCPEISDGFNGQRASTRIRRGNRGRASRLALMRPRRRAPVNRACAAGGGVLGMSSGMPYAMIAATLTTRLAQWGSRRAR